MKPNGKLYLDFKRKQNGRTYVARQFYQLPLQVLPANHIEADGSVFVYLLNPSGGMLENDVFDYRVRLEGGASAVITTPSSNKIYRSHKFAARQEINIEVGSGCKLEYLPEHNMPYAESVFSQKNIYRVHRGGMLFAWDTVIPGRLSRSECFDFTQYCSDTQIYYDDRLLLRDALKIDPSKLDLHNAASLGQYTIFSTAYLVDENISEMLLNELYEYFERNSGRFFGGASKVDENLAVIKVLFKTSLEVSESLMKIWSIVRKNTLGKPSFHIRKY